MPEDYTYEWEPCEVCGYKVGHALTCSVWQAANPPKGEVLPPGTRAYIAELEATVEQAKKELHDTGNRTQIAIGEAVKPWMEQVDALEQCIEGLRKIIAQVVTMAQHHPGVNNAAWQRIVDITGCAVPGTESTAPPNTDLAVARDLVSAHTEKR